MVAGVQATVFALGTILTLPGFTVTRADPNVTLPGLNVTCCAVLATTLPELNVRLLEAAATTLAFPKYLALLAYKLAPMTSVLAMNTLPKY